MHSIAVDSKGNIYTTETYTGKRLQKFVFKGMGAPPDGYALAADDEVRPVDAADGRWRGRAVARR